VVSDRDPRSCNRDLVRVYGNYGPHLPDGSGEESGAAPLSSVEVAIETPAGQVLDHATWIRLALMATLVGYLAIIWVSHFVPLPPFLTGPLAFIRLLDD
jgi:hypothetical protein